ncbi:MAG TPA: hypothetical protein ENH84_00775 [Phycisphaerae bacterium]|nr:hypothetical protein [Phycisphaerae bacterium]
MAKEEQKPENTIRIHEDSIKAIADGVGEWMALREEKPQTIPLSAVIFQEAVHVARELLTHVQPGPMADRYQIVLTLWPNGVWIQYMDNEDVKVVVVPFSNIKEMTPVMPGPSLVPAETPA